MYILFFLIIWPKLSHLKILRIQGFQVGISLHTWYRKILTNNFLISGGWWTYLYKYWIKIPLQAPKIVLLWKKSRIQETPTQTSLIHQEAWRNKYFSPLNFSLNRPLGRFSHRVAMSVCLSVCLCVRHTLETTLPDGLETSGRRAYR